ncbi:S41 family peptidase [Lichenicola cladoniae]|uniref:S41 family peptidase n=1 Tax=Lichenicola cladoniae TaxID=1484109 RepID=A0A6M8HMP8_9PROT|nr:S41 family peptidase [Lichenicola cladoniae]NPD67043.1 S41 family peptidase [Acetobacteraceae bacterium]QKE89586.1 S41 family peptidase [Lichenicola cladoniae]
MTLRNGLLLGTAFLVGALAGPEIGRLANSQVSFGTALAQEVDQKAGSSSASNPTGHAETYRLLTLFGDVFERVRADYVSPVTDRDLINNALNGMLTGLDPHSSYMTAKQFTDMQVQTKGQFGGLGLEVSSDAGLIKVITPMDGTPAFRAGMKTGDYIISINGKSLDGVDLNDAVDRMRGAPATKITLTIKRPGKDKPYDVTMTREIIHIQVIRTALYGKVAYIRMASFDEDTESGLRTGFEKLKKQAGGKLDGVILDLRNDPGGLLDQAVGVCDDFITSGEVVSTRARHPEDSQRMNAHGTDITGGLPLVVLINEGSASASEIVAGALQDHRRSVTVGTRSFGKGSVQTVIPLAGDNGAIRLTTARYYTPSGRSIQGLGITPDIKVRDSREDDSKFMLREGDLAHIIKNEGGTQVPAQPRTDLPAIAKSIPDAPPVNWPAFDPTKPATDFQLQQGLKVVNAMAGKPTLAVADAPATVPAKTPPTGSP